MFNPFKKMNSYANDFNTTVQTYYQELKKISPLSKDEEKKLIDQAKNNNLRARNKVLTSNLKFVFDVAKKYKGRGVSIDDLIAEGNVGLTKALDKYDNSYDTKFISYAVWWIRQSMQACIKNKNKRESIECYEEEEITKVIKSNTISDNEDEIICKIDVTSSNKEEEEEKERNVRNKTLLKHLFKKLDEREKYIISHYYGLEGKPETLEEIGNTIHLSKERIRQVKEKSLRKLRSEALLFL